MHDFFKEIAVNHVFNVTILSWIAAQSLKVFLGVLRTKRFDFRWFIGTGGMPSAHSAGSTALAVVVGQDYGFDSAFFALAAVFAMVTMFDAQGVRRSSGKQAVLLNKILDDIYWKGRIREDRLKELLGHTPVEVFMGSVLGLFLALNFHR
jgi:acid phosphatase family membrane protein YuiD